MIFLLDQGLPRSTVDELKRLNINSTYVGEIGLAFAKDIEIIKKAIELNSIIVTLDSDFHAILALNNLRKPSVIRIRMEGLKANDISSLLLEVLKKAEKELKNGSVISVTKNGIRIHSLPLV